MSIKGFFFLSRNLYLCTKNVKCMSYKSPLSLDKIYPKSINITPFKPPESTSDKFTGYIPINELEINTMRASGPGGQHVNKTETKVEIRFHVKNASWISESTKQKLMDKYSYRINKNGYFIVRSEKTKSQILNRAEAIKFIRELIFQLEEPIPKPTDDDLEKHRKNADKAARRRLMEKRTRALIKASRGPA